MVNNKIKNYFKKAIIAGIIGTGILSCEKEEYYKNPSDTIISKETKILDENQLNKISKINSTSISFSQPVNYSRGDILVAGISQQSPEGFLKKVESISSDKKTIITSNADLEQVIIQGEIDFEKKLTLNDLKENKQEAKHNFDGTFSYPIDFVLYDLDNNLLTTNDQIKIEGNINFKPELKFNAKFDKGIKEISLESKLIENADLSFKGKLEKEIDTVKTIASISFKPILVTTTPIPIVLTPEIELKAGSQGYLIGELQFETNQELEIGGKLNYSYGDWHTFPICKKDISGNVSKAFFDAQILAYLNQRFIMNINGIVGPFMEFQEYSKVEVNSNKIPWWSLNAGFNVDFGSDWGFLSPYLPEINKTIIHLEETVLQATAPQEPLAKLVLNPSFGEVPLDVYFDGANSTSGAKIIEYYFDFNDGIKYIETESSNDGIFDGKTIHQYVATGTYFPKLTIKDELSRTSTIEGKVEVSKFSQWFENFEEYEENTFPTKWVPDANAYSTGKIKIENGNKVLEMEGYLGGCWGALAYREKKINLPYEIQIKIKNGDETLNGCHPFRGGVSVINGEDWWDPSFSFFYFEQDGTMKDHNNETITKINLNEWHDYKIRCEEGKIYYFIDGTLKKSIDASVPEYKNIDINSNEGTARFDDILVKSISKK